MPMFAITLKCAAPVLCAAILLSSAGGVQLQRASAETPAADREKPRALPENFQTALTKAEAIELYSLQPVEVAEGFRGWKVLGKTTVKEEELRKKLVAAVAKGVADSDGSVAKCFQPRHGVRVVFDGKTYDLVICFECLQIYTFIDKDTKPKIILTADSAQPTLDKILTANKVPLADKPKP